MRTILRWLLGLIAVFFALIGPTISFRLPAQAAKDRVYYEQFKAAAAYIEKNGKLPSDKTLRQLADATAGPNIWYSLNTGTPQLCDPSFAQAPRDRLILSFWRGEWSECYAYPSGPTTLPMTVRAYLLSGLGVHLIIYWLIAIGAAWGAIRIQAGRKTSAVITPNGS